jgi:hypothetical protein
MLFAFYFALNSSVVYFAYFLRIKSCPFLIVKSPVKRLYVFNTDEVDKGITNIAVVEKVYW